MIQFKPQEKDFVGVIKSMMSKFIENSQSLTDGKKSELLQELGTNFYDKRFDGSKFIEDAVGYAVFKWEKNNLETMELWKNIAINNATVNNAPHITPAFNALSFSNG